LCNPVQECRVIGLPASAGQSCAGHGLAPLTSEVDRVPHPPVVLPQG
jgi:hypothetical protein